MSRRCCTIDDCTRTHYGLGYCRLHYKRHYRNGHTELGKPGSVSQPRLQLAPLRARTRATTALELARLLNVHPSIIHRANRHGLTIYMADRWAIHLGLHPALVWGDDFYQEAA